MRRRALALLAVALLWPAGLGHGDETRRWLLDEPGLAPITPEDWAARPGVFDFLPGERLDYDVRYLGIPIGRVWLEVARFVERDGVRLAHLTAGARTNGFWDTFYRIDDVSEAWVDLDRGTTIRTATHTHHGRHHESVEQVDFDWETHYVRVREERRDRGTLRLVAFDFGAFVHDTFDLFYAIRSLPLEPGFAVQLPVYANRKVYAFHVEVVRREPWKSDLLGPGDAFVIRPYDLLDGEPTGNGAGEVWVRADGRHVPMRLVGWFRTTERFRVAGIRAELVGHRERLPGWPEPPKPRYVARPPAVPTEDGRPRWTPPPEVREARERRGVRPVNRKIVLPPPVASPG
ncbi:MAG TPA: DUF3108 domain-containing protein [Myxococcota bacterium]|nr:DUF3108 domain-containing protein [Myxococcota bacterium]